MPKLLSTRWVLEIRVIPACRVDPCHREDRLGRFLLSVPQNPTSKIQLSIEPVLRFSRSTYLRTFRSFRPRNTGCTLGSLFSNWPRITFASVNPTITFFSCLTFFAAGTRVALGLNKKVLLAHLSFLFSFTLLPRSPFVPWGPGNPDSP